MTSVQVVVASKHGATRGIAERIAATLAKEGLDARVHDAKDAPDPARADAVVLVAAVYAGRWLSEADAYVRAHAAALRERPVWIATSGPVGFPLPETSDAVKAATELRARGHVVFDGAIDMATAGIGTRLMLRALRKPGGDFRDWSAVDTWARGVASALRR